MICDNCGLNNDDGICECSPSAWPFTTPEKVMAGSDSSPASGSASLASLADDVLRSNIAFADTMLAYGKAAAADNLLDARNAWTAELKRRGQPTPNVRISDGANVK